MIHTLTVTDETAGQRLDKFLSSSLPDISRARLQALIEQGAVSKLPLPLRERDGVRGLSIGHSANDTPPFPFSPARGEVFKTASHKIKSGETYRLTIPELKPLDLTPATHIPLDVVYEDDDILILNKQAGLTVHPAAGTATDTLVHALLAHCGNSLSGIGGVARPGIVHRLDRDTTGLLAIAKNDAAHQSLSTQLQARDMKRHYIAYVWGAPTPRAGMVDAPIGRHKRHRQQMAVIDGGRASITHYETDTAYRIPGSITPIASKIRCELDTGRTHQIRVHMLHLKCPLLGDALYGASTQTKLNRLKSADIAVPEAVATTLTLLHRQALHAAGLVLTHPKTGEFLHFTCPLPEDLQCLETALVSLTE